MYTDEAARFVGPCCDIEILDEEDMLDDCSQLFMLGRDRTAPILADLEGRARREYGPRVFIEFCMESTVEAPRFRNRPDQSDSDIAASLTIESI